WHPTQPYLIWSAADRAGRGRPNFDLYLMKYEIQDGKFVGGKVQRVTDAPTFDLLPVFSPDGKKLMWTSGRSQDHTSQLYLADFVLPKE
ncbi:MAG: biopolymer transporter Tol, partial [Planctomycetales bacterium]